MQGSNMADLPHVSTVIGRGSAGMAAYQMTSLGPPGAGDGVGALGADYRQMLAGPNDTLLAQY